LKLDIDQVSSSTGESFHLAILLWRFATATSLVWLSQMVYRLLLFGQVRWLFRMHLGVHYPSDVVSGAIIGSGSAYLTYKVNKWINK
jgi:membrane-associated phospholipid phosphatase